MYGEVQVNKFKHVTWYGLGGGGGESRGSPGEERFGRAGGGGSPGEDSFGRVGGGGSPDEHRIEHAGGFPG